MDNDSGLDTSRPFTVEEAHNSCISTRRLRSSELLGVVPGVYIDAGAPLTHLTLVRAALKHAPLGIVSGRSAARLWNAVVPASSDVELTLPRKVRVVARGIREHRPPIQPETVWRFGIRVTTPTATFMRLAAELDLVDLVVAGDSLVRQTNITPADLLATATEARTRRSRLARRAAALVREGVDSPQETRLRLLTVFAGMPEPTTNILFFKDDGEWEYRLDSGLLEHRVAFEYDGRQHETDAAREYDGIRRKVLGHRRWTIHSFVSDDLFITPDETVDRLRRIHDELGICHEPSQEWRRHFQVRRKAA